MSAPFKEGWDSYRTEVISRDAPPIQVSESKLAFYAGAMHLFSHLFEIGGTPSNPTQESLDVERLESIHEEIVALSRQAGKRELVGPELVEDPHEAVAVSQATGWSVVEWGDSPSPSMPASAVGLVIQSPTFRRAMEILVEHKDLPEGLVGADLMIRLKSARAVDELAAALLAIRDSLWPDRVHVCLGCGWTLRIEGRCHPGKRGGA